MVVVTLHFWVLAVPLVTSVPSQAEFQLQKHKESGSSKSHEDLHLGITHSVFWSPPCCEFRLNQKLKGLNQKA